MKQTSEPPAPSWEGAAQAFLDPEWLNVKEPEESELDHVADAVLRGENARMFTEGTTRRRQLATSAWALKQLAELSAAHEGPDTLVSMLVDTAVNSRDAKGKLRSRTWLRKAALVFGIPAKTFGNLIDRGEDERAAFERLGYAFDKDLKPAAEQLERDLGKIELKINGQEIEAPAEFLLMFANYVGASTLAIRGSAKSSNGKRLEAAVLRKLCTGLGYTEVPASTDNRDVFWLSSKEGTREADATILLNDGRAVRFDIGFIGAGNPEIVKDKLSRYQRREQVAGQERDVDTVIIIDALSEGSGAWDHADELGVSVVAMRGEPWAPKVATAISKSRVIPMPRPKLSLVAAAA